MSAARSAWPAILRLARASGVVVGLACALNASAAGNKAPTVSITAPAAGATFAAPATITIAVNAADADGAVARVDFYQGTTLLGTRVAAPYTFTWTGVGVGSYSLTAKATDNAGASKTSTAVAITVAAPKIAIAQPAAGSVVYGTQALVTGTFSGEAGSTIVVDGPFGSRIASISGTGYSAAVPIVPGALNTLRATLARRNRTFDAASASVLGNLNPLVTFIAPATSSFDTSETVSFEVDALSPAGTIARVDFLRGGALLGSATARPYRFAWANPPAGSHVVSATATDNLGYAGTVSLPVTVSGSNQPPTVALTAPAAGATFTAPATVSIAANAGDIDGTVALVEFLRDGAVIGTTNVVPYAMSWTGAGAGTYALAARATDNRGATATSAPVSVTIRPPNSPPTVALNAPPDGARFTAPATITLSANATDADGTVVRVDFLEGSTMIGSATSAPYTTVWSNVAPGSYSLTARAVDNTGASATSAAARVAVVANVPPTVAITSPADGARYDAPAEIVMIASASDPDGSIARVEFLQGGTLIGAAAGPSYTMRWSNVAAGAYTVTARAIDSDGASATSAPVSVVVAMPKPVLAIESPASGAAIAADHVHVQGVVDAPPTSGVVVNGVVAAVDSGHFYAANIPLAAGANTVTATLTHLDGATTVQSIDVTRVAGAINVAASPAQGFAPLAVSIVATAQPGLEIAKMEIDADGGGSIDGTILSGPWEWTARYLSTGTVNLVVRVTDTTGAVHVESVPIVVVDKAAIDQRVRAVWAGMTSALTAGDTAAALTFLDPVARRRYGPALSVLQPYLATIVGTFSNPQGLLLTQDFGEYAVNRVIDGQNRLFFIYFGRNGDGVWRVGSM